MIFVSPKLNPNVWHQRLQDDLKCRLQQCHGNIHLFHKMGGGKREGEKIICIHSVCLWFKYLYLEVGSPCVDVINILMVQAKNNSGNWWEEFVLTFSFLLYSIVQSWIELWQFTAHSQWQHKKAPTATTVQKPAIFGYCRSLPCSLLQSWAFHVNILFQPLMEFILIYMHACKSCCHVQLSVKIFPLGHLFFLSMEWDGRKRRSHLPVELITSYNYGIKTGTA